MNSCRPAQTPCPPETKRTAMRLMAPKSRKKTATGLIQVACLDLPSRANRPRLSELAEVSPAILKDLGSV